MSRDGDIGERGICRNRVSLRRDGRFLREDGILRSCAGGVVILRWNRMVYRGDRIIGMVYYSIIRRKIIVICVGNCCHGRRSGKNSIAIIKRDVIIIVRRRRIIKRDVILLRWLIHGIQGWNW